MQGRQAHLGGSRNDVLPLGAGIRPRMARRGIEVDAGHRRGLEQHGSLEVAERGGRVTGPLRCDSQAALLRGANDPRDVCRVGRKGHQLRALVDAEVEGLAGEVPVATVGLNHASLEARVQHRAVSLLGRHRDPP